jgi:hypothetical protein
MRAGNHSFDSCLDVEANLFPDDRLGEPDCQKSDRKPEKRLQDVPNSSENC